MKKPFTQDEPVEIYPGAKWIWPGGMADDLINCYVQFRKSFNIKKTPASAPAWITADQSYQLWINGHFVNRGPARGFQASWPVDKIDMAPWLREGNNVIAVRAYNPGFSNFQYRSEGTAAFLFSSVLDDQILVSNSSWRSRRETSNKRDTLPISIQLFPQEHHDARLDDDQWMQPDFNDSGWNEWEITEAEPFGMPWAELEPRGIPLLKETLIPLEGPIGACGGISAEGYESSRDVYALRINEQMQHTPCSTLMHGEFLVEPMARGTFRSYLLELPHIQVGSLELHVDGTLGGEIIDATYYETIDFASLTPDALARTSSRIAMGTRLVCRPHQTSHRFYHFFGFRYLLITVRDALRGLSVKAKLNGVGYPLEITGCFESSDPMLNRIWQASARTQQLCMLDAYVDTPWREQAQWWGDARIQGRNTFYLANDTRLFRRGIRQIGQQTSADGLTYGHAPTVAHFCILPDFTLMWILSIWDDYWQTGSIETFLRNNRTLHRALEYFKKASDGGNRLMFWDSRYWLFLDWTDLYRDGASSVYNLWLLLALEKLVKLSECEGDDTTAASLRAWESNLRRQLLKLCRNDGLICDGITPDGRQVDLCSVQSQTLAIMTGLDPAHDHLKIDELILPVLRGQKHIHAEPSAYWWTYILQMLSDHGRRPEGLSFIRDKWAAMADFGSTWETFNPRKGEWSHSHAWTAHPIYHLMETIGGIKQISPGWKEVDISPVYFGKAGRVSIPIPQGLISVQWQIVGNEIRAAANIPEGVTATIKDQPEAVRIKGGTHSWVRPTAGHTISDSSV